MEVSASYAGIPEVIEKDYLGGCTYKDGDSFKADGYYHDMVDTVTRELRARLETIEWHLSGGSNCED